MSHTMFLIKLKVSLVFVGRTTGCFYIRKGDGFSTLSCPGRARAESPEKTSPTDRVLNSWQAIYCTTQNDRYGFDNEIEMVIFRGVLSGVMAMFSKVPGSIPGESFGFRTTFLFMPLV